MMEKFLEILKAKPLCFFEIRDESSMKTLGELHIHTS